MPDNKLDYPFIIAHFYMETDTGVFPIVPTAKNMAALILNVGFNSDVDFISPDGLKLAVSDGDNGISYCFDAQFLSEKLLPALEHMKEMEQISNVVEAEVDPETWNRLYETYYDGPADVRGDDELCY